MKIDFNHLGSMFLMDRDDFDDHDRHHFGRGHHHHRHEEVEDVPVRPHGHHADPVPDAEPAAHEVQDSEPVVDAHSSHGAIDHGNHDSASSAHPEVHASSGAIDTTPTFQPNGAAHPVAQAAPAAAHVPSDFQVVGAHSADTHHPAAAAHPVAATHSVAATHPVDADDHHVVANARVINPEADFEVVRSNQPVAHAQNHAAVATPAPAAVNAPTSASTNTHTSVPSNHPPVGHGGGRSSVDPVEQLAIHVVGSAVGQVASHLVIGEDSNGHTNRPDSETAAEAAFVGGLASGVVIGALNGHLDIEATAERAAGSAVDAYVRSELGGGIGGGFAGDIAGGLVTGVLSGHLDGEQIVEAAALHAAEKFAGEALNEALHIAPSNLGSLDLGSGLGSVNVGNIVAGFAVNALMPADSKEMAMGQSIGSAIGAVAIPIPFVGSFVGGIIGGIIGGMFADEPEMRSAQFKSNTSDIGSHSAHSQLGTFGLAHEDNFDGASGRAMDSFVQGIAKTDDAVVNALRLKPDQLAEAKENLANTHIKYNFGYDDEAPSTDSDIVIDRYTAVLNAVDPRVGDLLVVHREGKSDMPGAIADLKEVVAIGQKVQAGRINSDQLDQLHVQAAEDYFKNAHVGAGGTIVSDGYTYHGTREVTHTETSGHGGGDGGGHEVTKEVQVTYGPGSTVQKTHHDAYDRLLEAYKESDAYQAKTAVAEVKENYQIKPDGSLQQVERTTEVVGTRTVGGGDGGQAHEVPIVHTTVTPIGDPVPAVAINGNLYTGSDIKTLEQKYPTPPTPPVPPARHHAGG